MRAKIIHYNSAEGNGIAVAEEKQYNFNIHQWRSSTAPATGQTIDMTLDGETVSAVSLVSAEVLAKERASQLASGLGAQLNAVGSRLSASAAQGNLGKTILQLLPIPVLVAYVVYFLSSIALNIVNVKIMGKSAGLSLWNLTDSTVQLNVSGIRFFLIIAFLSIAVPVLWQNKRAWFALLLPLIPLLQTAYGIHSAMSQVEEAMGGMGGYGLGKMGATVSDMFSVGLGGYGIGIAAIFLAAYGLKRALVSSSA
ncbi:MAG: hypothetical protein FWF41_09350 [Betaproteobacteria bacterium]|nr:hypothetical protein [Betaproteobacteria bacterium]